VLPLPPDPVSQKAWSSTVRGGEEGSLHGEEPEGLCVGFDSLLRFLSAAEWANVQQTARYLCPGFKVSSPVGVDIGVLKELLGSTFVDGLQEIEGWFDFAGAAEELAGRVERWNPVDAGRPFKGFQLVEMAPRRFLGAGGPGAGVLDKCEL
jgi:hypothetical protein